MDPSTNRNREGAWLVVLNALRDLIDGRGGLLADDTSTAVLTEAYQRVTEPAQREAIERAFEELSGVERGEVRPANDRVSELTDAVLMELEREGVDVTFVHETGVEFTPRQVGTYAFARDPSVEAVEHLSLPDSVRRVVHDGAEQAAEGAFERAAERFEQALETVGTGEGMASIRLLAGWAHFWDGADDVAADLADEVLDLEGDVWEAKLLWIASTHERADRFRDGELDVGLVLNWISLIPEGGTLTVETAIEGDPGEASWAPLETDANWGLIERVGTTTRIRFTFSSPLPGFPRMDGYFLAVATMTVGAHELGEIERVLLTGPETADSLERVTFSR